MPIGADKLQVMSRFGPCHGRLRGHALGRTSRPPVQLERTSIVTEHWTLVRDGHNVDRCRSL